MNRILFKQIVHFVRILMVDPLGQLNVINSYVYYRYKANY